jgi:hypothetical protein
MTGTVVPEDLLKFWLFIVFFTNVFVLAGSVPSVEIGPLRIQALSPTLVRLEVQGPRGFEDRSTFHVVERAWPGTPLQRTESGGEVMLRTGTWSVRVPAGARDLRGLRIEDARGATLYTWDGLLTSTRALPAPGSKPLVWAVAAGTTPACAPTCFGSPGPPSCRPFTCSAPSTAASTPTPTAACWG